MGAKGKKTNLYTVVIPSVVNSMVHSEPRGAQCTRRSNTVHSSNEDKELHGAHNLPVLTNKKKPTPSAPIGAVAEAFCLEHGIGGRRNKRDVQDLLDLWRKKYSDSEDGIAALWTQAWNHHQKHHDREPWHSIVRYLQAGEDHVLQDYKMAQWRSSGRT